MSKQMACLLSVVLVLAASPCLAFGSLVQLQGNYYTDVTVSLPHVAAERRTDLLSSLEELFEISGKTLHNATKERATFLTINVLIPASWGDPKTWLRDENATYLPNNGGQASSVDADVVFTSEERQGARYALNADGCGMKGERIYLPLEFLSEDEGLERKGEEFVRLWSQYRYGVFPENGFVNDSRYPQYFSVPGSKDLMITSCTNGNFSYNFTDGDGNSCEPSVDPETGKPTTESGNCELKPGSTEYQQPLKSSSLMDVNVQAKHFCDSDISLEKSHNYKAPSKHNALCSEDGTWFVILRNEDFARGRNAALRYRFKEMQLRYVQESNLRIVVAVDVSSKMKDRYSLVKNALSKFVLYDLPRGSEVGLVFFTDEIKETSIALLTPITDDKSAEKFLESGTIYDEPEKTSETCVECALLQAMQILQDGDKNGIIILITSDADLNNAEEYLRDELNLARVRLSAIQFSPDEVFQTQRLKSLAESTGGSLTVITDSDDTNPLFRLHMTFTGLISGLNYEAKSSVLVAEELGDRPSSFSFNVDDSIGEMKFLITGPNFDAMDSPFEESSVQLRGPGGMTIPLEKNYLIPAWVFSETNVERGSYKFTARRKPSDATRVFAMAFGKPKDYNHSITLRTWTSFQKDEGHSPIKIFAELRNGSHPVKNAKVVAIPFDFAGDLMFRFCLVDDGLGDPDITQYDGIYSSYFVNYTSPGYYSIIIKVIAEGEAETVFVSSGDCCGSYMPEYQTVPTGQFNRYAFMTLPILRNFNPEDAPPNRIMDLQVSSLNLEEMMYNLTWSAAGADYNLRGAANYKLKLFSDRNDAKRRFETTGIIMEYNKEIVSYSLPSEYGGKQEYAVRLPETLDSGHYYFAVSAVDEFSNVGQVSNVVEVIVSNTLKNYRVNCSNSDAGGRDPSQGGGCSERRADIFAIGVFMYLVLSFMPLDN